MESTIIAVGAISLLSIVTLHRESAGDSSALLVQAESLVAIHDWTFLFGPGFCVGVGNGIILGYLMWKSGLVPRRMAMLGLIGGPLVLVRATLILFDVVEPGDATDALVVPEILWEASLGLYRSSRGSRRRRGSCRRNESGPFCRGRHSDRRRGSTGIPRRALTLDRAALPPVPGTDRAPSAPDHRSVTLSPMASVCPRDGTQLVEVERSGVRVDACRTCRGVWLDRGELDKILERESQAFERQDRDDEAFLREVTGGSGSGRSGSHGSGGGQPGFDRKTAERIFEEFRGHKQKRYGDDGHGKRRKKSFLDELLG